MILSTIQPSFLPWLGYFEQMARADLFVYLDDVQYTKQDWRNRNRFKAGTDKIEYLTVPIQSADSAAQINAVRIADGSWAQKLVGRLQQWYGKAPFFDAYFPSIRDVLLHGHNRLSTLDVELTALLASYLGIETKVAFSSDVSGKSPDKNQKLIDICRHFGATVLYDGAAAASFIDLEQFRREGIEVVFQDYRPVPYAQLGAGPFLSHLSTIDTLFNCGPATRQVMLDGGISRESALGVRLPHSACPVCGESEWESFLRTDRGRSLITDQTVADRDLSKVICAICGVVSNADAGGAETLAIYEHAYRLNTRQGEEHVYFTADGEVPRSRAYLEWVKRHLDIEPGSILEIGCGKGSLLARLAEQFPAARVQGIDGNHSAVEIAQGRGLTVAQGFVGNVPLEPADLVVAVGVLEHVEDPQGFLEAAKQGMSAEGRAIFVVPLQDTGGYDLFFADHVWHVFGEHFLRLLERCGWSVLAFDAADPIIHGMGLALCRRKTEASPLPALADPGALTARQVANRDAWRERFFETDQRLAPLQGTPLIVFGAGEMLGLLLAYTALAESPILGVVDEDSAKAGSVVHGIEVHDLKWLAEAPRGPVFVTVNPRYHEAVTRKLADFGRPLVFWGDSW